MLKLNTVVSQEDIEKAGAAMLKESLDKTQRVQRVLRLQYISSDIFVFPQDERIVESFFINNKSELMKHCKDEEDYLKYKNYARMAYSYDSQKKFIKSLKQTKQDTF